MNKYYIKTTLVFIYKTPVVNQMQYVPLNCESLHIFLIGIERQLARMFFMRMRNLSFCIETPENMATPAKVSKPEGKNNHENADEQAGERILNIRDSHCRVELAWMAICPLNAVIM